MSAALSLRVSDPAATGGRPPIVAVATDSPSEPFPERITCGCPRTAITLRGHETSARLQMEREAARVEANSDRDRTGSGPNERQRERAHVAATKYRAAAEQARAFARLAELHEAGHMPSPLFTVRTRRHVRTVLAAESYTGEVETALRSALRWTLGLPMHRRTGFEIMREGFERLGLLAPVVLPLAVSEAIQHAAESAPPSGDALPVRTADGAPGAVVVEVAQAGATVEQRPATVEAFIEVARRRAAEGWIGHVTQFAEIQFAEAFEADLSLSHTVEAARDWITGCVVFGPLPFAWGEADGTHRPFWRDAAGRLRTGKPSAGEPPVEGEAPEPTDGGGGSVPTTPEPTVEPSPTEAGTPAEGGQPVEEPEHQEPETGATRTRRPLPASSRAAVPLLRALREGGAQQRRDDAERQRELARAEKLDGQAATAERKADHQRNLHAGQNLTRRRAQARAAGMQEAKRLSTYATALRAIAQAIRTGTCPAVLARVTTRAHVERLVGVPSGPEGRLTTPSYPSDEPAPHEWQEASRDKRRRAFARMGIESGEQFEAAVEALAGLIDGHQDPEREAKARAAEIERMVETARLARITDYFRTPADLVDTMLAASGLYGTGRGVRILEPSAGDGAILDAIRERFPEAMVEAVEPSRQLGEILRAKGHSVTHPAGFESFTGGGGYDVILMNPPFGKGGKTAMDHIERAASMLREGGRLVGFVPESIVYRTDRRHTDFRAFVDEHGGSYIDVPAGAFDDTGVKTRIVVIDV